MSTRKSSTQTEADSAEAFGRKQREVVNRSKLGELARRRKGFDPIAEIRRGSAGRLRKLLPVKYQRMAGSAFAFFRGSAGLMAGDLAREPRTELMVQLCGDAHLQNMGCFEGPDGRVLFDINDFDETMPGPWEWDAKRMAASIVLAGKDAEHQQGGCCHAVEMFASSYCRAIQELAQQPILTAARHQIHRARNSEAISAAFAEAERASPQDLLRKYTQPAQNGAPRFRDEPNVIWPVKGERKKAILASIETYKNSLAPDRLHLFNLFRPLDVGFKVVGTGSVGLRNYIMLMEGNGAADVLFLQIKQEALSTYAAYLKSAVPAHQGQRVVEGQRRIQPSSDLLLGWTQIDGADYLVRQLNDHKGGVDLAHLRGDGLAGLAGIAGELLARGHARSGNAGAIRAYIGNPEKVVKSLVKYGTGYAERAEGDFEVFRNAMRQGKIRAAAST